MGKTYIGDSNNAAQDIKKIYIGLDNPNLHNLPNRYTELEYIQSDGISYIDTNYNITSNTKIIADFQIIERKPGLELVLFCGYNATEAIRNRASCSSDGSFKVADGSFSQTEDIKLRTTVTSLGGSNSNTPETNNLIIFENVPKEGGHTYSRKGIINLYSLEIYETDTIVKNYIPCIDKIDNIIGLYDIINNEFFPVINDIPENYERIEYIESTGSQYIDTNYKPSTSTAFYANFINYDEIGSTSCGTIFGESNNLDGDYYLTGWTDDNTQGRFCRNDINTYDPLIVKDQKVTIAHSITNNFLSRNDDTTLTTASTSFDSLLDIYLFAKNLNNTVDTPSKTKLYSFTILERYESIHDYVPVVRKLDDKPGLYDVIDQEFLTNDGEDEFLCGNPIKNCNNSKMKSGIAKEIQKAYLGVRVVPPEYTPLEYIENNNYEYIDSGVLLTPTIKVEADFQITEKKYGFVTFIFGNNTDNKSSLRAGIGSQNSFDTSIGSIIYSQTSDIFARTSVVGTATSGTNPGTTLLIFASRRNDNIKPQGIGKIKLYSLKIYDNNVLIRNFIPCKRNSDSINGLYDIVNNVIYTNANPIPSDYQQVEYLQSTGSQYIDTGCSTTEYRGTYITFNTNNSVSTEDPGPICGVSLSSNGNRYYLETWESTTTNSGRFWIGTSWASCDAKITPDTKLTIGHSMVTKTVARDDNSYATSATTPVTSWNMYAFGYNEYNENANLNSRTKIYYLSFLEKYEKIHEYIPVIRKLDNKPGMYDVVSGTCLFNKGEEDDFLYGEPVNDFVSGSTTPLVIARLVYPHYQKVEYIQSSGTQYIDTGVIPNENTRIQMKFRPLVATGGVIIGYNTGNDNTDYRFFNASSGNYFDMWNKRINGGTCSSGTDYTYELGNFYVKNLLTNTNVISGAVVSSFTGVDSIKLNAVTSTSGFVNVRWYYVKIYDGTTLIRNLYPCYRTSDNAIGMFDIVEKKFYNNNGTGVFIKGSDL